MDPTRLDDLLAVASRFQFDAASIVGIEELGNGNVNDTYRVLLAGEGEKSFVLQRLNQRVFPEPRQVMSNILIYSEHVNQKLRQGCSSLAGRRWEVPRVLKASQSGEPWLEQDGDFWRGMSFIEGCRSFDTIKDPAHGWEVGVGLGLFHSLISDLPSGALADTLPGFHITPGYLQQFHRIAGNPCSRPSPELAHAIAFVRQRQAWATVLEDAKASGALPLRPIHGDPKINNLLLEESSGRAIALIDLDTVKPGLIHYDIGDCLRSGCNGLGEETAAWQSVRFDLSLCEAILRGYGSIARSFLTSADYDYLFDAIRLITFELGLRFLTDHLAGDVYFKTTVPEQNLARSLVQFRLTESIEEQESSLRSLIDSLR
jgi:Ser/Thr protein kinase RdoA (MazF antagonist)